MSMSIGAYIIESQKDQDSWIGNSWDGLYFLLNRESGDILRTHLTDDEQDYIKPTWWPEPGEEQSVAKDAELFMKVIIRVVEILMEREEDFPLAHMIVEEGHEKHTRMSGSISWRDVDDRQWSIHAFHQSVDHRNEVQVITSNGGSESSWVNVQEQIEVGSRTIMINSQTWYEYHKSELDEVIDVCKTAIAKGLPLLWVAG